MAFEFTDSNFKAELESGKPIVIDFWASGVALAVW